MGAVGNGLYLTQAGWNDAGHMSEATKADMLSKIEPHLRAARSEGEPTQGVGAIYPIGLAEISCAPFRIPEFWPRCYALDVGWNRTAAIWLALDRNTDTVYAYSEYYGTKQLPQVHAIAIRARGEWIPGVIDPAARGRSQADGTQLLASYRSKACGLHLTLADNSVETGLQAVWSRMLTGRFKVFTTLQNWGKEFRLYHRGEDGKVVKVDDHLMDCTRYGIISGVPIMRVQEFRAPVAAYVAADSRAGY